MESVTLPLSADGESVDHRLDIIASADVRPGAPAIA